MHRVLILDDHALVRGGFCRLLENSGDFAIAAEASTASEALAMARRERPDVAVIDLSLGTGSNGLALLTQMATLLPAMKRVVLSMHDDPGVVQRALDAGADGYVTKAVAPDELLCLLRRVMLGQRALSSDLASQEDRTRRRQLSPRELQTVRGLVSDKPPKAIAIDLGISDKTLYRHRANLMEKLGIRTTHELKRIAIEQGWLLDPQG